MAPLAPVAQVVWVKLSGTIGIGRWNNVHHLQYTGIAPTNADLATLATSIATAWSTNIAPLASTLVNLTGVTLADLSSPLAATANVSIAAIPGTRAGVPNPNSAACVISWPINMRYRGGHPRTYMPLGVNGDVQNGSLWTTAFHTAALAGAGAYRTALNALTTGATTYKMVAVSRNSNGAVRPQPIPVTIQPPTVHGRVDTQRLRLGRETP